MIWRSAWLSYVGKDTENSGGQSSWGEGGALTRERQISAVFRACDSKLGAEKGRVCRWPMGVGAREVRTT